MSRISRRPWMAWLVLAWPVLCGPLGAQEVPTVAGAALGAAGGAVVTVATITAEARLGRYIYDVDDVGWRLVPIPAGLVAGAVMGYRNEERLRNAALRGLIGLGGGGLAGALLGGALWRTSEAAWAGWILGSAAGMVVGSVLGALEPTDDPSGGPELGLVVSLRGR